MRNLSTKDADEEELDFRGDSDEDGRKGEGWRDEDKNDEEELIVEGGKAGIDDVREARNNGGAQDAWTARGVDDIVESWDADEDGVG